VSEGDVAVCVSRPKLTPYLLPTKDGGVLHTVGDVHAYIIALPKKLWQAPTLRKPSARQDAWHFAGQRPTHPSPRLLACGTTFGATTVGCAIAPVLG
jgi:hypothetical protein